MKRRPSSRRWSVRRIAFLASFCVLATACDGGTPGTAQPGPAGATISPIQVRADPVLLDADHPSEVTAGKLTYLAGFELTANDRRFGGLSSLVITPDGQLLTALSDRGYWVEMHLDYNGDTLSGIGKSRLGVLGSQFSRPLTDRESDSESLALDHDGSYLVGFEKIHRIWRYPPAPGLHGPEELTGVPINVPMPRLLQRARSNQSLESLEVLHDGRILTILELPIPGEQENHAWLVNKNGSVDDLFYDGKDGYSPTDLSVLPNGDVMVVERYFRPLFDVRARFRVLKLADIKPGAHLEGTLIAEIKPPRTVDNMEGLASRTAPDGSTLIYVISDDNYSPLQRTLLLEFRLDPDAE
jgi:hypothetical protein